MPAIQPERLNKQVAEVVQHFADPQTFIIALKELFEFYADRTRKPGQVGAPPPLIPSYYLPTPVLRRSLRALLVPALMDPEAAFALVDALWQENHLELRLLGARLLGHLPTSAPEPVLERVQRWAQPKLEDRLLHALLSDSLAGLRKEAPQAVLTLAADWLASDEDAQQHLGLRALLPLVRWPGFDNLPVVFEMISPLIQAAPSNLRPYLLQVVQALIQRSPRETAYFLRQALSGPRDALPAWLIRQSIDLFPPEMQAGMRAAARPSDQPA